MTKVAQLNIEWSAQRKSLLHSTTQWTTIIRDEGCKPEDVYQHPRTLKGADAFISFAKSEFSHVDTLVVVVESYNGSYDLGFNIETLPFNILDTLKDMKDYRAKVFDIASIFASALELGTIHALTDGNCHRVTGDRSTRKATERRIHLENIYAEYVRSRERREHQGGTHASPVRHSVREHLRQLKNGRIVYVRPHVRGSREPANNVTIV